VKFDDDLFNLYLCVIKIMTLYSDVGSWSFIWWKTFEDFRSIVTEVYL